MKAVTSCPLLRHLRLLCPKGLTWFRANATAKQDALLEMTSPLSKASSLKVVQILKDSGLFCEEMGLLSQRHEPSGVMINRT